MTRITTNATVAGGGVLKSKQDGLNSGGIVPPTVAVDKAQAAALLDAALAYARRGWHVFPCHTPRPDGKCDCGERDCDDIGKHPRTAHGFKDATTDEATIRAWWRKWPTANIGGAAGIKSGFDAADPDGEAGLDDLAKLEAKHGALPDTPNSITGGGGKHLFFKHVPGKKNTVKADGLSIDLRTTGGYVILPPSLHRSGRRYEWEATAHPDDLPLADMPAWLRAIFPDRGAPRPAAAITTETTTETIPEGRRNATLTSKAGALHRNNWSPAAITAALWLENTEKCKPPLDRSEVERIVASVTRYPVVPRTNGVYHAPDLPPLELADLDAPLELADEAVLHMAATTRRTAARTDQVLHPAITEVATADQEDDYDLVPEAPDIPPITWLDDYCDLMIDLTCAPRSFHRLCGLVALSMAVGPGARLRMSFGDIHGNLYAAIIGESSAYYKTTAMRQVRNMLTRAALPHYLLQAQFTSEGLTKALSEQSTGLILRDELSTLFASHRQKYSQFVKSDLTAIFDGDPFGKLKAGEVQKVDKPYLSILGTTTPDGFYNAITGDDWRTGFLARWLFALPDTAPDFDSDSRMLTQTDEAHLQALATTLIKVSAQTGGDFLLDADAHHRWNTWRKEERRHAFEVGGDVVAAIASRYGTYALKIAMLLSAVTDYGQITDNNMVAAIALAGAYKTNALRLFTDRRNYGVTGAKVQKVFGAISRGGGTSTTRDLLAAAHMTASELQPILDVLTEQGAITADKAGRGFRFTATTDKLPIKSWVR